ncbi:PmoA family protein [Micromonospora sp. LOL_024]|uniref:DUF6807 domain-containing protein n=1 Tax=Micromonospora sp. LOL_024 TaxID=3345412 RepID=UPI003A881DD2
MRRDDPPEPAVHLLRASGVPVAWYAVQPKLPLTVSPRPYFHPVRTLHGVEVTEALPPDHPHHLGVSVAMPEAGEANFWGGRTYTREDGYRWLDNHGTQHHLTWHERDDEHIDESVGWYAPDGRTVLTERRTVGVHPLPGHAAWVFDLGFALANNGPEPVELRSPTCNGRPEAGYGGFFWRVPKEPGGLTVLTAEHDDVDAAYGTASAWLTMNGSDPDGRRWSLLFVQDDVNGRYDRWFVRTAANPGVGTCLAWARPVTLAPGDILRRRVRTAVLDGGAGRDRSLAVLRELTTTGTPPTA